MAERRKSLRSSGFANIRAAKTRDQDEEEESLLADEERAEEFDGLTRTQTYTEPCPPNPYGDLPVYTTIHRIRREIMASIDDPYSVEQLKTQRMNISIVRPLVDQLYDMDDVSVVYCLLVNRVQFLREQPHLAHRQSVNSTRALLCELVATKILRRYNEDNTGPKGLLLLANILVAGFEPFQNAPEEVLEENSHAIHWATQKRGGYERKLTTLEVGIISESKSFLSSTACQRVVDAIYRGSIIYTPSSFIGILPDHYKHKPIGLYDPKKAPLLNQYRLIVPRTRNILEVCQFLVLLILYLLVMANRNATKFTNYELVFCIYATGWVLDQTASILEHGWQVYTQNLWSFLDVTFAVIYGVYLVLRIHGIARDDTGISRQALDILSTGAPVLVPRLAFNLMSENMLFVSLRAMMADFTILIILAVWSFAGFLLAMVWLSNGLHQPITISKWMLWVWFGLDGTGIQRCVEFHWLLGPILMVAFAFLGNTLFLTILVSMLSNTFSNIVSNATAEIQFRRAVLTFEGVKGDAIFAYQPPFNILALCIMLPLYLFVSPRWFHKINVAAVRTLNAPLLFIISIYERKYLWKIPKRRITGPSKRHSRFAFLGLSRFSVHGDIQAVFESEPPESVLDEISDAGNLRNSILEDGFPAVSSKRREGSTSAAALRRQKARQDSIDPFAGLPEHLSDVLREASGGSNTKDRLEALETSTKRIEDLLLRLCEDVGGEASEGGAEPKSVLGDHDKSQEE